MKLDLVQGTLDMLVLKALTWGPMHGYAVLAWLGQATGEGLNVEDAALYPALHRLAARGLVAAEWGLSENRRRARYYRLTAAGRKALVTERETWTRYVELIARVLNASEQPA